jgi:predicted amidohydrolase YtcJ
VRAAAAALDATDDVERDEFGEPTGRLWRLDDRLRTALPTEPPSLDLLGNTLSALGITGVTDATPDLDAEALQLLGDAVSDRTIHARVHLLGAPLTDTPLPPGLAAGPHKILLRDHDLPDLDTLVERIANAHSAGRAVAVHCVTRESLLLVLVAFDQCGTRTGDRIEHAAVVPPEARNWIARLGLRIVTQPGFVTTRGDCYLADVDPADQPHLYPYASLLQAGIPVAPSSDAPFGPLDPWQVIAAATTRHTPSGNTVCGPERVPTAVALDGYLSPPDNPGGPPRRLHVDAPADLCLLHQPLSAALSEPSAELVRLVTVTGRIIQR